MRRLPNEEISIRLFGFKKYLKKIFKAVIFAYRGGAYFVCCSNRTYLIYRWCFLDSILL